MITDQLTNTTYFSHILEQVCLLYQKYQLLLDDLDFHAC